MTPTNVPLRLGHFVRILGTVIDILSYSLVRFLRPSSYC